MTRKDYERIASVIKNAEVDAEARAIMARAFAKNLTAENPRFKLDTWFKACNVEYI